MVHNSTKDRALALLAQKLDSLSQRLFSPSDLTELFIQTRAEGRLPKSFALHQFQTLALEANLLKEVELTSTHPLHTARYHRGDFSPYELSLSLRPGSYLCHGTAALLHGLADEQPDFVYANKEQSAKEQSGSLTQAALNRAFSGKQRQSRFIVTHNNTKIMLLIGKDTGELAVSELTGPGGVLLRVTN